MVVIGQRIVDMQYMVKRYRTIWLQALATVVSIAARTRARGCRLTIATTHFLLCQHPQK
jgi:hypothetical protein